MPTAEDAIDVVTRLAAERGWAVSPRVVADKSNLVLHLEPLSIVARVAMATSAARVGMAWLAREVDVSRFLGAALSTVPIDQDAGPHERDGFVISFWELEQTTGLAADPAIAGQRLAACHRALRAYPRDRVPHLGAYVEVDETRPRVSFDRDDGLRVDRAVDQARRIVEGAAARSGSMQAVHGDAHLGNVLATKRGVLWTDWEDAFGGPIEHDLACLRSKADLFGEDREAIERAYAAYDVEHDASLVRDLGLVRNVQVIVWLALFAQRQPELLPRMRARIAKLPA